MSWTAAAAHQVLMDTPALGSVSENIIACIARFTVPACENATVFEGKRHDGVEEKICFHVEHFGMCRLGKACDATTSHRYFCYKEPSHIICKECWYACGACGFDCGFGLCPACTFETLVCACCDEQVPYCGKSSCPTTVFECCDDASDDAVCGGCADQQQTCSHCMKTLCGSCKVRGTVHCSYGGCRSKAYMCEGCREPVPEYWFKCECDFVECDAHTEEHTCRTCDQPLCKNCTECEKCTAKRKEREKAPHPAPEPGIAGSKRKHDECPLPAPTSRRLI